MSVAKDKKTNLWYYVFKVRNPITGKLSWKKKRGFATKRDALHAEADAQRITQDTSGELTFREMSEKYMDSIESSDTMRQIKRTHFIQRFSDYYELSIKKITPLQLDAWRAELSKNDNYAFRTKNTTVQYVRAVFNYANKFYGLPAVDHVLKPLKRPREIQDEQQVWTIEEFNTFLKYVEIEIYKKFFIFLYWTGCRRGEAMALHHDDINISECTANIVKSIKHFSNGELPTKTGKPRKINLTGIVMDAIKPLLETEGVYLFGSEHSLSISGIQREFDRAKKKATTINQKVTVHGLRHSFATNAISNGCNIIAVSKHLGHSKIDITLNTYSHLLEQTDAEMLNIIEKLSKS